VFEVIEVEVILVNSVVSLPPAVGDKVD